MNVLRHWSLGLGHWTLALGSWTLLSLPLALGAESGRIDPSLPYQASRTNAVTYDVDFSAVVTAPYQTKLLRVWLPIPQTDAGQELLESSLTTFPEPVTPQIGSEPLFGNKFAYFEFSAPQGAQIVRHKFRIKVWELNWNLKPELMQSVAQWPESFEPYRRSESQAVVIDAALTRLLEEIVPRRGNPLLELTSIMAWANEHFTYDHVHASLTANSRHALEQRRGHCSDYHGFCASVGRALGYPTRITYGINPFPKSSPSHCKLEMFLPPYGWVSFDVSETQKLVSLIQADTKLDETGRQRLIHAARQRLAGGFRDNTWFVQTRGTDYELVPKASRRVPVVRTIFAEADGVPLAEPDPANSQQNAFTWMTAHRYEADRKVTYPFKDWTTLDSHKVE